MADLNLRELATLVPLVILVFWIGIYPAPFFKALDGPVDKLVETVRPGYFDANPNEADLSEPAEEPEVLADADIEAPALDLVNDVVQVGESQN